jgi:adenine-specific methyltransferase|nr:DNA adenine methylase [Fusobacterium nucleatum]
MKNLKLFLDIENKETNKAKKLIEKLNLKQFFINNRRYLGNKYSLTNFIKKIVEENCKNINTVADVFSGTGSVSDIFKDRELITNDLLYCNYISNYAWFFSEDYSEEKVINTVYEYNKIETSENNYVRENFADTFFSADDCSKIGYIREDIEKKYKNKEINYKEYSILITTLLYAMDRIANTVGHYDAYRKKVEFDKELYLGIMLPDKKLSENNKCFNEDATNLVKKIKCDLLYLDPPYNSRQYSDAYHLLENIAKWQKPEVFGVARKMDRKAIKSSYCTVEATQKFRELIENTNAKYILLSYNNMSEKGDDRSNAKISDKDIFEILEKKGKVKVFEEEYKMFSTGKSNVKDNKERLFLCEVEENKSVSSLFNYTGGKYKLLEHLQKLFKEDEIFLDIFTGGANVGINSKSSKIIFNDVNDKIISLMKYIKNTETEELLKKIDNIILDYGLSNTMFYGYEYYSCNSSEGLANYNKEPFLKLREDYNRKLNKGIEDYACLYVLIVFSFNNQVRFNSKGEFNLPVGKRDFNSKMRNKLILFSKKLKEKDIEFYSKDFREIDINKISKNTFVYCDPPYLITTA